MTYYTRRAVLETSLRHLAGIFATLCVSKDDGKTSNAQIRYAAPGDPLSWNALLERIAALAEGQNREPWNQDEYVQVVGMLCRQLDIAKPLVARTRQQYTNRHIGSPEFAELERRITFQVSMVSFEKDEVIPPHNHPDMTGVMLCVTGTVAVNNYELISPVGPGGEGRLRRVGAGVMTPKTISTLTAEHRNIHSLRAATFSEVIDIFTPPYDSTRIARTVWYRLLPPRNGDSWDIFPAVLLH
jgi:hypothetical protein